MQLFIYAGCECVLFSLSDCFIAFEYSDFCFCHIWAYGLGVLPRPIVDHLFEMGFSHLPHWIKKTSDLIESPTVALDFLSRFVNSKVK